jgi:hypothetical protein
MELPLNEVTPFSLTGCYQLQAISRWRVFRQKSRFKAQAGSQRLHKVLASRIYNLCTDQIKMSHLLGACRRIAEGMKTPVKYLDSS